MPAHYARAYAYHLGGYPDKAIAEANALLATDAHDPYFLELKGQILLEGGKPAEAIPILREATQRSGDAPLIAAMLGHALVATEDPKNFTEAKQILKVAVNRDNDNPFAWYQLGIIYDREGDMGRAALATAERSNLSGGAENGPGKRRDGNEDDPDRHSGLASRTGYRHGVPHRAREKRQTIPGKGREKAVSDPKRPSSFAAAVAGGVIGSLLTAVLMIFAAPQWLSSRIVREGMLADPQILADAADSLRDAQYKPVLDSNRTALETPFGSSWRGAAKPDVTLVEFFDYACPYCKASNPHIDRLVKEDKGLRVVYRELPILGPDSVSAARLSLEASKLGRFNQFHDALWAAGRPGAETLALASQAAGIAPAPKEDPAAEAELRRNFQLAGQLGATGTPLFVIGNRVMNAAVGYDALKKAIADARRNKS